MELRHLRYFVAVASHGSFNRAAEILHLTQPALSRQVRDLEEELGIPLFARGPNTVKLTEAFNGLARKLNHEQVKIGKNGGYPREELSALHGPRAYHGALRACAGLGAQPPSWSRSHTVQRSPLNFT